MSFPGLVFSRSLTNNAVVAVLMWYFTYYGGDLVTSAVLSNIQDALSSILVIVMANLADSFIGRYKTILFSNTAYIGVSIANPSSELDIMYNFLKLGLILIML